MNIAGEYLDEIERIRTHRNVLREILVDEIQFTRNISRDQAEARVDREAFQKLQRQSLMGVRS